MSQESKAPLPDRVRAVIMDAIGDRKDVEEEQIEAAVASMVASINRLKVQSAGAAGSPRLDDEQADAHIALNAWFTARGSDVSGSTPDSWNITRYLDAFIFSTGQRRSNSLYMVRGDAVVPLSAAGGSLKDAYDAMGGTE